MGRFKNAITGVVVSVADEKDERYSGQDWGPADDSDSKSESKSTAKKTAKSDK